MNLFVVKSQIQERKYFITVTNIIASYFRHVLLCPNYRFFLKQKCNFLTKKKTIPNKNVLNKPKNVKADLPLLSSWQHN